MRISKINKLMLQSQQNLKNLSKQYIPHFNGGCDYDYTVVGRVNWMKCQQPRMYATSKDDESIQTRSLIAIQNEIAEMRSQSDQALEFIKLQHHDQILNLLEDVKGNNIDEKIYRSLEYDLNSFKHLNDKKE